MWNIVGEFVYIRKLWPGSHELWSCLCPSLWWIRALLCGTGLSSEVWMWGTTSPRSTGHHTLPGAGTAWKAGPYFTKMSLVPMWRSVLRHPAGMLICQIKEVTQYWKDEAEAMAWKQWCMSQENKIIAVSLSNTKITNIRTNISLISYISHWTADRKPLYFGPTSPWDNNYLPGQ